MRFGEILTDIVDELHDERGSGRVADYIAPLAQVDPKQLGVALVDIGGGVFFAGDSHTRFSIQSIAKVFALTLAIQHGEKLWARVGREPSGNRFNSLVQLEVERGIPRNPFINAGALVVTDVILAALHDAKGTLLALARDLSGADDVAFDTVVATAEAETGHTNMALAHFIKSFGNLDGDPAVVLDAYFHHCSVAMSCVELATAGVYLANGGRDLAGTEILTRRQTKRMNALMMTCGAYDAVGDFAFRVGLPAKSGVGGGILAVLPGHFSVCAWSPGLDAAGNSVLATTILERLCERTELSIF
jgi:glutaminase